MSNYLDRWSLWFDGMKGLILKDWYMTVRYFRMTFPVIILFVVISFFADNNNYGYNASFFAVLPCVLAGIIPTTLYTYDERDKWFTFSQTLPVTKSQFVWAKYVYGLMLTVVVGLPLSLVHTVRIANEYHMFYYWIGMISELMIAGMLPTTVLLPFMFKFGAEKGRVVFIILMLLFAVLSAAAAMNGGWNADIADFFGGAVLPLLVIGLFFLSGFLSVKFYEKREF